MTTLANAQYVCEFCGSRGSREAPHPAVEALACPALGGMSVAGLSHFQDFSPFGPASHLDFQPVDPSISRDTKANASYGSPVAARQLSTSWMNSNNTMAPWGSMSSCESPEQSPQQQTYAMPAQRSSGGSSPTAVPGGSAALPTSSSAPFPAYNLQQPSVGFYRREPVGGLGPAIGVMGRPPDHLPDAAGFNLNKSITKRLANATHYQQVLDIIADSASCFDEVRPCARV